MNANTTTYAESMSHSPAISERSSAATSSGLGKGEPTLLARLKRGDVASVNDIRRAGCFHY